jgi:hypothetical protein
MESVQSVSELVLEAELPERFVVGVVPIERYVAVAEGWYRLGTDPKVSAAHRFVALLRVASLFAEHLPLHPDFARKRRWHVQLRDKALQAVHLAEEAKLDLKMQRLGLSVSSPSPPVSSPSPPPLSPPPPPPLSPLSLSLPSSLVSVFAQAASSATRANV